jgi:hypothetical protein
VAEVCAVMTPTESTQIIGSKIDEYLHELRWGAAYGRVKHVSCLLRARDPPRKVGECKILRHALVSSEMGRGGLRVVTYFGQSAEDPIFWSQNSAGLASPRSPSAAASGLGQDATRLEEARTFTLVVCPYAHDSSPEITTPGCRSRSCGRIRNYTMSHW